MTRWSGVSFAVALVAWGLGATASASAADAQYQVLKCHVYSRSALEVEAGTTGPYFTADSCASSNQRLEVAVNGFGLPGQSGYVRYTAPEGTAIVGVNVDANLRRDNHHFAQLAVVDAQGNSRALAQGADSGDGFQSYSFSGLNDLRFVVQLFCSDPGGCPNSSQAHAYARNIDLVLADRSDPAVTDVSGDVVDPGGSAVCACCGLVAADVGSGVLLVTLRVNSIPLIQVNGACGGADPPYSSALVPCGALPATRLLGASLDTQQAPFVDGTNQVQVCVEDFAGNQSPCSSYNVAVDNAPPTLGFTTEQDPGDPELIRVLATDSTSGIDPGGVQVSYRPAGASDWTPLPTRLADGALLSRVDSGASDPGMYEFQAAATDRAGNSVQTTRRTDGEPMLLRFPTP